jgi:RNA polymerase sigma-70 factor (ECF subfamily)
VILIFTFTDAKDAEKFEYLYKKYKRLLYYKANEILRDPMAAEDALSETMIRVYRNMDKIGNPDSPESAAFLTTIVRNVSLTLRKKQISAPELMQSGLDEDKPENGPADPFDMEESVLDKLTEERLCIILGKIDEESRNIFVLKYAYDLSHREIASQLSLTESNVTVRLHRIRKRLAKIAVEEGLFAG